MHRQNQSNEKFELSSSRVVNVWRGASRLRFVAIERKRESPIFFFAFFSTLNCATSRDPIGLHKRLVARHWMYTLAFFSLLHFMSTRESGRRSAAANTAKCVSRARLIAMWKLISMQMVSARTRALTEEKNKLVRWCKKRVRRLSISLTFTGCLRRAVVTILCLFHSPKIQQQQKNAYKPR